MKSENSSKIILDQSFGFHNNNFNASFDDSFQQQFIPIYCLQIILKSIWMLLFVSESSGLKKRLFYVVFLCCL